MKKVLFICPDNAVSSQIAEGLLRKMAPGKYQVCSAGITALAISPFLYMVMAEMGSDISCHCSKRMEELENREFDYIIPISCGDFHPEEMGFKGEVIRKTFSNTYLSGTDSREIINGLRKARNEIKIWLEIFFDINSKICEKELNIC